MKELPRTWLLVGGSLVGVVGVDVVRRLYGLPVALLVCTAVLLVTVVVLMWNSLQALDAKAHMSLDDALTLASPAAEEEQKRAVLRSLKDLEYERRVGKVRDEDYVVLAARYREEARILLGQLDTQYEPIRQRLAQELSLRLEQSSGDGVDDGASQSQEPRPTTPSGASGSLGERVAEKAPRSSATNDDLAQSEQGAQARGAKQRSSEPAGAVRGPTRRCHQCADRNSLSANECGNCGTLLASAGERLCRACPARYPSGLVACPECDVPAEDT